MINQQQLDHLINDIEYLKSEIQSLNKVISFVPYSRKPLGGESIIENLLSINHKELLDDAIMNEIDKVLDNKPTPEQDLL